ncbi:MAG: hypothetical protein KAQ98_11980 [Bacteriovoracaceae bacterium]|nr:hypothetical protein [Bacteriovoracaceae bacterium]
MRKTIAFYLFILALSYSKLAFSESAQGYIPSHFKYKGNVVVEIGNPEADISDGHIKITGAPAEKLFNSMKNVKTRLEKSFLHNFKNNIKYGDGIVCIFGPEDNGFINRRQIKHEYYCTITISDITEGEIETPLF